VRFMIIVKATDDSEADALPDPSIFEAMADYHKKLADAGVLLDASGLHPSSRGWRIQWEDGEKRVTDGPFTETKELIAGYTLIQVDSVEEAREWADRFPNPHMENGEIEIRRLRELDEFPDGPHMEGFREIQMSDDQ